MPQINKLGLSTKILAPDGHQVTLAEVTKATGIASLWCDSANTGAIRSLTLTNPYTIKSPALKACDPVTYDADNRPLTWWPVL